MLQETMVKRPQVVLSLAMSEVVGMNILYCVGWTKSPVNLPHPLELSKAQLMTCRRIWANSIRLQWVDGAAYDV